MLKNSERESTNLKEGYKSKKKNKNKRLMKLPGSGKAHVGG